MILNSYDNVELTCSNNKDESQIQARALRPYTGTAEDHISFPANAIITVLKKEAVAWRGKFEGRVSFAR